GEGSPPLGLESLAHASLRGLALGASELEAVPLLGGVFAGATQRADAGLEGLGAFRRPGEVLVQGAELGGQAVALGEELLELGAGGGAEFLERGEGVAVLRRLALERGVPVRGLADPLARGVEAVRDLGGGGLRAGVRDAQLGLLLADGLP